MIALASASIGAVVLVAAASAIAVTVSRRPRYVGRHRTLF